MSNLLAAETVGQVPRNTNESHAYEVWPGAGANPSCIRAEAGFVSYATDAAAAFAEFDVGRAGSGASAASRLLSRLGRAISVVTSSIDIVESVQTDKAAKDKYFTNTTRAGGRGIGTILLSGAASVAAIGAGISAAPALALAVGAGLAGAAIGDQAASALVWARKNWF